MDQIIRLVILLIILLVPIKYAAKIVGAKRTNFLSCFIALVLALVIQHLVVKFYPQVIKIAGVFDDVLAILLVAIAYMLVLRTSYIKGVAIAVLQIAITLLLVFLISFFKIPTGSISLV